MLGQDLRILTDDFEAKIAANPFFLLEQKLRIIANSSAERYYYVNNIISVEREEKNWEGKVDVELKSWRQWAEKNELNLKIERKFAGLDSTSLYYWSATITW